MSIGAGLSIALMFAASCVCYFQAKELRDLQKRRDRDLRVDFTKDAQIVALTRLGGLVGMGASAIMLLLLILFPS